MASDWTLIKTTTGYVPADPETEEKSRKVKIGNVIHGKFSQMRRPRYHRKFFAMLNLAFDYWEPGEINSEYGKPEKNFDRFRRDAIILSGHYHVVVRLDGTTRIEADSISFANMDQQAFEKVYNGVLNVFMQRIPHMSQMGEEEVNRVVDQLIAFG